MSSKFVVKKKTVANVIDGCGPLGSLMSVAPRVGGGIYLVVGAYYVDKCACSFNKEGVKELIDILSEIHAAMEG